MKTWYLSPPYTQDDRQWIINSGIEYDLESPHTRGDSDWCDIGLGQQLLTSEYRIYLHTYDDKHEMWLLLKYDGRAVLRYAGRDVKEALEVKF
jgi:hypothetical protein